MEMSEAKKFNPEEHFMDLKGKKYLQVMWRLVWFREEHPDWMINTEMVEHVPGEYAVFKASIWEPHTEMILSTGYGSETRKDFGDFLEKAETKAVGRALAMLGYGTQFAPELDEGERIVDSPVSPNKPAPKADAPQPKGHCKMCGTPLFSGKDGVAKKSQSGETVFVCNSCNEQLKAKKNANTEG